MDEVLVDVTAEAQARIARGAAETRWRAHVHTSEVGHMSCIMRKMLTSESMRPSGATWQLLSGRHQAV